MLKWQRSIVDILWRRFCRLCRTRNWGRLDFRSLQSGRFCVVRCGGWRLGLGTLWWLFEGFTHKCSLCLENEVLNTFCELNCLMSSDGRGLGTLIMGFLHLKRYICFEGINSLLNPCLGFRSALSGIL